MKKQDRNSITSRPRPTLAPLAVAVAALVALPVAFASGAEGPVATKSASLAKQVKSLKKRVAALESRQTSTSTTTTSGAPSGPGGGDLTGTYPNPTIGVGKVNSAKVADASLTSLDIADGSLTGFDLSANSLFDVHLTANSVGASELKAPFVRVSSGAFVPDEQSRVQSVTCDNGSQVLAGGYAWNDDESGTSIIASAPNENNPTSVWDVVGRTTNDSGNTLYGWALCLQF